MYNCSGIISLVLKTGKKYFLGEMKVSVLNEQGGTDKIFSRLILKDKAHKKKNLHLKSILIHILRTTMQCTSR